MNKLKRLLVSGNSYHRIFSTEKRLKRVKHDMDYSGNWLLMNKKTNFKFRGRSITIVCTDKERSLHFYRDILGADSIPEDEGYGCPWLRLGKVTLSLMPNASSPCPMEFPKDSGTMLWLETDHRRS